MNPPHMMGSSNVETETRVFRTATAEGDIYVKLAKLSLEVVRQLEQEAGKNRGEICKLTGGIIIGPKNPKKSMMNNIANFAEASRERAQRFQIRHAVLTADEIRKNFSKLKNIKENDVAYVEEPMGYIRVKEAIEAQLNLAKANGAEIHMNEKMQNMEIIFTKKGEELVHVITNKNEYYTRQLVIATGPWIQDTISDINLHVSVTRQIMVWFEVEEKYIDYKMHQLL